jgi:hypothetical protein
MGVVEDEKIFSWAVARDYEQAFSECAQASVGFVGRDGWFRPFPCCLVEKPEVLIPFRERALD